MCKGLETLEEARGGLCVPDACGLPPASGCAPPAPSRRDVEMESDHSPAVLTPPAPNAHPASSILQQDLMGNQEGTVMCEKRAG